MKAETHSGQRQGLPPEENKIVGPFFLPILTMTLHLNTRASVEEDTQVSFE